MSEHTNGRLIAEDGYASWFVRPEAEPKLRIATLSLSSPRQQADARRLVACWNACQGISTELLENANAHGMLDLAEKAHKGKQLHDADRDELIEALEELLSAESTLMPPFESGKDAQNAWSERRAVARDNARAILAKHTPKVKA